MIVPSRSSKQPINYPMMSVVTPTRCVGVFDTIGSVGLPEEITRRSPSTKSIFGFPNTELGEHIERAYQALAINETRLDFVRIRTISDDLSNPINFVASTEL